MSDIVQFSKCDCLQCIINKKAWLNLTANKESTIHDHVPTSFLSLVSELHNRIYKLILLCQEPINPGLITTDDRSSRLRFSTRIRTSTANLARYSTQNSFSFTIATSEHVASFLEQISSTSITYIQHVYVDFPRFLYLEPGDITSRNMTLASSPKFRATPTWVSLRRLYTA